MTEANENIVLIPLLFMYGLKKIISEMCLHSKTFYFSASSLRVISLCFEYLGTQVYFLFYLVIQENRSVVIMM